MKTNDLRADSIDKLIHYSLMTYSKFLLALKYVV
jgi:hypothetical protein